MDASYGRGNVGGITTRFVVQLMGVSAVGAETALLARLSGLATDGLGGVVERVCEGERRLLFA